MTWSEYLSVSALAWPDDEEGFALLQDLGVRGVELLPSRIINTPQWSEVYKNNFAKYNLQPVAFQALYFGLEGAALLGDQESFERLKEHTLGVAHLADQLGVPLGVFGAPALRKFPAVDAMHGRRETDLQTLGAERLAALDQALQVSDFSLCIEPLSQNMGCDYLHSCEDVVRTLNEISATRLCPMLDTASTHDIGLQPHEVFHSYNNEIRHVHFSEPSLSTFRECAIDFRPLCAAMGSSATTWASIEMLCSGAEWKDDLQQAVKHIQCCWEG